MRIRNRRLLIFGLVIHTVFSAFAHATGAMPAVVGKVVRSSNATVDGNRLLPNGTVLSGDAVTVGEDGLVLLSYSPTGRAVLAGSTSVRFSSAKGNVVAQLISGTLAVEKQNQDAFVVKTSTYSIEPQGDGRAEFVVALLPDKRATVETQHGKVVITESRSGETYTLAEGLVAQIPAPAPSSPTKGEAPQQKVIGQVVSASAATQNGKPLSIGGWILDGDDISTEAGGSAVVQLLSTNQVTLSQNTSTRFTKPVDRIWLFLQSGAVTVENKGESIVLIATRRFHVESNSTGPSKIFVEVRTDESTYMEAMAGDVRIREVPFDEAYLLPAGQNTLVPKYTLGLPGLKPLATTTSIPTPMPEPPPSEEEPSTRPQRAPGTHSNHTIIIVGIAAGGGIAGIVAALAGGGGGSSSPPVSPSAP
jgi:hypothetical protein